MTTHTDFNLDTLRGRVFQGFLEFVDPGDATKYFRLKERQTASFTYNYLMDTHYRDDGVKNVDPAGYNHSVSFIIKLTSDLFDNTLSSPSTKTLTYWLQQLEGPTFNPVQITFAGTITTLSGPAGFTTEKYIHFVVSAVPNVIGPITYNAQGGVHELTITAEIISITVPTRSATQLL